MKTGRGQGSGFRVPGSGFKVPGSRFWVQGSGFLVPGSWFRDQSSVRHARQNPGTLEPRNPGTAEPRNPGTQSVLRPLRHRPPLTVEQHYLAEVQRLDVLLDLRAVADEQDRRG